MSLVDDLILSIDVETTGPTPGLHSMLSFAVAPIVKGAIQYDNVFYKKLKMLPGATWDESTKRFWMDNKTALKEATTGPEEPEIVMDAFLEWVKSFGVSKYRVIFVADPGVFDGAWIQYYVNKYLGMSSDNFIGRIKMIDMRSQLSAVMNTPYSMTHVQEFGRNLTDRVITHNPVDDTLCQAEIFLGITDAIDKLAKELNALPN